MTGTTAWASLDLCSPHQHHTNDPYRLQVDPHSQKEAENRVAAAASSVEEITQAHAKLQVRMREIEAGATRMVGEHRNLSTHLAALDRQRGELSATVRVRPQLDLCVPHCVRASQSCSHCNVVHPDIFF